MKINIMWTKWSKKANLILAPNTVKLWAKRG